MTQEEKNIVNKIYRLCQNFINNIEDEENYTDDENEIIDEIANFINTYEDLEYCILGDED